MIIEGQKHNGYPIPVENTLQAITELNNVNINRGTSIRYFYDEKTDMVTKLEEREVGLLKSTFSEYKDKNGQEIADDLNNFEGLIRANKTKPNWFKGYSYDPEKDIITTKEIMTPDHLFTCLRCSGWEYVSEEEKVLKDK